jgi:hypothetical protein
MRREVAAAILSIFNAPDRVEAERRLRQVVEGYRAGAPRLATGNEENVPEGMTITIGRARSADVDRLQQVVQNCEL